MVTVATANCAGQLQVHSRRKPHHHDNILLLDEEVRCFHEPAKGERAMYTDARNKGLFEGLMCVNKRIRSSWPMDYDTCPLYT